jgi:hypothetical protein
MKSELKILLIKLFKFIAIFTLMDYGLGSFAEILFFSQESGKYARITYTLEKASGEIFIFGNSYASRHFIPRVFEDELKISCYNAGVQGQGLLFINTIEEIVLKRTIPKLIILNLDYNWLCNYKKSSDLLFDLYPYFLKYQNFLKPNINSVSRYEYLKLYLKSYRFNSTIAHIIKYFLSPQKDNKGYNPLFNQMPQPHDISTAKFVCYQKNQIDDDSINLLIKFILSCKEKNIDLLFVISPTVINTDFSINNAFQRMKEIAGKYRIPVLDYSNDNHFVNKYNLFFDWGHLNNHGAVLFSKLLAQRIKNRKQLKPVSSFLMKPVKDK